MFLFTTSLSVTSLSVTSLSVTSLSVSCLSLENNLIILSLSFSVNPFTIGKDSITFIKFVLDKLFKSTGFINLHITPSLLINPITNLSSVIINPKALVKDFSNCIGSNTIFG